MPGKPGLRRMSLAEAAERVRIAEERYVQRDPLKLGIEPKIRPVVTALVAHGFSTQNSCEGHLGHNLYPWVRLAPQVQKRNKKSLLAQLKMVREEADQLTEFLAEFWKEGYRYSSDRSLQVVMEVDQAQESDEVAVEQYMATATRRFVALPGYMLQCCGADALNTIPSEVIQPHRKMILKHRQQDMLTFGKFLTSKL